MNTIIIRECTHDDIEAIFQLDQDWEAEGVSYTFTHGSREGFIADFERFQEYYFVAEHDGQVVGYINGSVRVNENQTDILPDQETYNARSINTNSPISSSISINSNPTR